MKKYICIGLNLMMSWSMTSYLVKGLIHLKFKYCRHRRCSSSPWRPGLVVSAIIRLGSGSGSEGWLTPLRHTNIPELGAAAGCTFILLWSAVSTSPEASTGLSDIMVLGRGQTQSWIHIYLSMNIYECCPDYKGAHSSHLGSGLLQISQWIFGRKFHFQKLQILALTTCKYYSQQQGHYFIFCNTLDINYFHNCVNILCIPHPLTLCTIYVWLEELFCYKKMFMLNICY